DELLERKAELVQGGVVEGVEGRPRRRGGIGRPASRGGYLAILGADYPRIDSDRFVVNIAGRHPPNCTIGARTDQAGRIAGIRDGAGVDKRPVDRGRGQREARKSKLIDGDAAVIWGAGRVETGANFVAAAG